MISSKFSLHLGYSGGLSMILGDVFIHNSVLIEQPPACRLYVSSNCLLASLPPPCPRWPPRTAFSPPHSGNRPCSCVTPSAAPSHTLSRATGEGLEPRVYQLIQLPIMTGTP